MTGANDDANGNAIAALKNNRYGLVVCVDASTTADIYTVTVLSECIGCEYGKPMEALVVSYFESNYDEPVLPEAPTSMERARRGKLYNLWKQEKYKLHDVLAEVDGKYGSKKNEVRLHERNKFLLGLEKQQSAWIYQRSKHIFCTDATTHPLAVQASWLC